MESVDPISVTNAKDGVLTSSEHSYLRLLFQSRGEFAGIVCRLTFVRGLDDNNRLVCQQALGGCIGGAYDSHWA